LVSKEISFLEIFWPKLCIVKPRFKGPAF
jgi:hypothetical protein